VVMIVNGDGGASGNGVTSTNGTVTVTENIPAGLELVSMVGNGWSCPTAGNTCTRNDSLDAGASYPPITVTANVAIPDYAYINPVTPTPTPVPTTTPTPTPAATQNATVATPGFMALTAIGVLGLTMLAIRKMR